ncbi:GDSL esterase/lipase 7 [Vitis vinifera]|uniref:GDSL esterase/lipase 7 n=1 Tax=Vitis vinifera TaxID=29760 RepID=A0A438JC63_VITVI|nr:GDSL esterase/lipase 7 [Vitis vinifera]
MEMEKVCVRAHAAFFPLLSILLVKLSLLAHGQATAPVTPAMFIFGDSLIDNGNNNFIPTMARANYFPYGIDFGLPTGRFCNGLTVVDYGAHHLGLPLIPPFLSPLSKGKKILRGLNYASAAAGILDETGQHYGGRTPFNGQISQFAITTSQQLPPLLGTPSELTNYLAKSVFLINIGSNDYINNYLLPRRYISSHVYSGEVYADLLINNLSNQLSVNSPPHRPIEELLIHQNRLSRKCLQGDLRMKHLYHQLGARKMVLVGIGPLGCIPSQLSMVSSNNGCVDRVNNLVTLFNSRLIQLTSTLNASLPGSFFVYQNIYNIFSNMVRDPSKYGFTVPNSACCGNGRYGGDLTCLPLEQPCKNRDQYIFWDSFHPTQAVNAMIAESCYTESGTECYPISIYQLAKL